ncbi:hypothetical protein RJ640_029925 [Escallonia rubra]|uniref:Retrotransposon gag domain-containing protein n=1 Tax=Escallonia rubra TaxID=112253 RepID=A0AA88S0M5_9ASTE|nr:hypothetical protein RJ640_029925 [Escallonia rubra]
METTENQCVKLVATRLHGYASEWWDKIQEMRPKKGKYNVISWEKMKSKLQEKFLPLDLAQSAFFQFNNQRQEPNSVVDYTEEFCKLMARNNIRESEKQLVARYIGGLKLTLALASKVEVKLAHSFATKLIDGRNLYPSTKGKSSCGGNLNSQSGIVSKNPAKAVPTPCNKKQSICTSTASSCYNCGQKEEADHFQRLAPPLVLSHLSHPQPSHTSATTITASDQAHTINTNSPSLQIHHRLPWNPSGSDLQKLRASKHHH